MGRASSCIRQAERLLLGGIAFLLAVALLFAVLLAVLFAFALASLATLILADTAGGAALLLIIVGRLSRSGSKSQEECSEEGECHLGNPLE